MKKLSYFFFLGLFFLTSCGNDYVIKPDALEDLLVDIHLAEGLLLQNSRSFVSQEKKVDLFSSVYAMHGVDKARFDSTMIYYSDDPTVLSDVYANVAKRLEDIHKEVDDGVYSLSKVLRSQTANQQILHEDLSLLPYVRGEFWIGEKTYNFENKKFLAYANTIIQDSIVGDLMLRFSMHSDSIASAQCQVTSLYANDSTSKTFDLPVDADGMVELKWHAEEDLQQLRFVFSAEELNAHSACELSLFRLYSLNTEARDVSLF